MGRIFKFDESRSIVCESQNTRYGFRHLATLFINGQEGWLKAKCCYYNRTWESFEFETVVKELLEKAVKEKVLTQKEVDDFKVNFTYEKTRSGMY
jgi:hypothetical protein